jgi:hypothetical protein
MPTHAFNKNMNKPRNTGSVVTQNELMSIRAQLRDLRIQTTPSLVPRPTNAQPKPVAGVGEKWHKRTVFATKTVTGPSATSFTLGNIIQGYSALTNTFRVKSVKVWNTTLGQGLKASLLSGALMISTATDSQISCADYGSGQRIAGIVYDVPDTLNKILGNISQTDATSFIDVENPTATASTVNVFVCHVMIEFLL